jgi:hypothetical protein
LDFAILNLLNPVFNQELHAVITDRPRNTESNKSSVACSDRQHDRSQTSSLDGTKEKSFVAKLEQQAILTIVNHYLYRHYFLPAEEKVH